MPERTLLTFFTIILLAFNGCGTIEKEKKANAMEATLSTYGEAIRWGYFDTAYGYVHPDRRKDMPSDLDNLRVTSYEVVQGPLMKDEESMEQVVRIEYVHNDEQRLRSFSDRQLWRFDKATNSWRLHSGLPQFQGSESPGQATRQVRRAE